MGAVAHPQLWKGFIFQTKKVHISHYTVHSVKNVKKPPLTRLHWTKFYQEKGRANNWHWKYGPTMTYLYVKVRIFRIRTLPDYDCRTPLIILKAMCLKVYGWYIFSCFGKFSYCNFTTGKSEWLKFLTICVGLGLWMRCVSAIVVVLSLWCLYVAAVNKAFIITVQ